MVRVWNELHEEVVAAGTVTMFKRHVDKYTNRKGLKGYWPGADRRGSYGLQSTFKPSQFGPTRDNIYTHGIEILQKRFSLRL
eukprot:g41570.t1